MKNARDIVNREGPIKMAKAAAKKPAKKAAAKKPAKKAAAKKSAAKKPAKKAAAKKAPAKRKKAVPTPAAPTDTPAAS